MWLFAAAALVLIAVGWHRRRSLFGVGFHMMCISLPLQAIKQLTGEKGGRDAFVSAMLHTTEWISSTKDVDSIARLMAATAPMGKVKLEKDGAKLQQISDKGVAGLWIAEDVGDIPLTIDENCTGSHDELRKDIVVLMYMHGGGYCMGGVFQGSFTHYQMIKTFNALERQRGGSKRLVIFSIQYPLAPAHPYPAQLEACINAFQWLNKHSFQSLVVGGDSAGGHCIIWFLNHLAKTPLLSKLPIQPIANVLISPWIDPYLKYLPETHKLDMFSVEGTRNFSDAAFGSNTYYRDIVNLPIEELECAPKGTFICYGGAEKLHVSLSMFVDKLKSKGCPNLQVHIGPNMPHTYYFLHEFPSVKPYADSAIQALASFIDDCIGNTEE
ncbi:Alpha/Beta hydrolase protein [Obelidium mucronatum]|nr:Alpha/Beta hydrolase protein [Obelidium mucronatum]